MTSMPAAMHSFYPLPRAIPTRYHFHLFRSRLEARWAVFFDSLGIRWTYEPEGYSLGGGGYLPDFQIGGALYAEVKPHDPPYGAWDKAYRFSEFAPILCLSGPPSPVVYPCEFKGKRIGVVFSQGKVVYTDTRIGEEVEIDNEVCSAIEAACSERFGT